MVTAILLVSVAILLGFIFSPLNLSMVYVVMRPLLQPFATLRYSFFGLPTTAVHSLIILLAGIVCVVRGGRIMVKHVLLLYVLLFYSSISFYYTPDAAEALGGLLKLLTAISLFVIVYNSLNSFADGVRFMQAVTYSSVIPILVGFYQKFSGNYSLFTSSTMDRADSVFGVANAYGIYLSLATIPTITLILLNVKRKTNILILGLILASQVIALNRGTWIAFSFAVVCSSAMYIRRIKIRWIIAAFLLIGGVFSGTIISRFVALEDPSVYGTKHNTLELRVNYWTTMLPIVMEKPIAGYGLGSARFVSEKYLHTADVPHNDYLRFAMEIGIPGTIIYISFLLFEFFRNFILAVKKSKWQLNYSMLILIIYYIVISATQNIYFNLVNFPLFLALVGMSMKLNELKWPEITTGVSVNEK